MKQFSIFLLAMLFVQQIVAQRYPFQWVNVPNGVSDILNNKYGSVDVGAGYNVYIRPPGPCGSPPPGGTAASAPAPPGR